MTIEIDRFFHFTHPQETRSFVEILSLQLIIETNPNPANRKIKKIIQNIDWIDRRYNNPQHDVRNLRSLFHSLCVEKPVDMNWA